MQGEAGRWRRFDLWEAGVGGENSEERGLGDSDSESELDSVGVRFFVTNSESKL